MKTIYEYWMKWVDFVVGRCCCCCGCWNAAECTGDCDEAR